MRFLFLILILFLVGCSFITPLEKTVYVKCKIPEVPRADLESIPENGTYPEKLQVILNNYLKLEKENEMLREAIKVCQ